jgi:hypothetical protein
MMLAAGFLTLLIGTAAPQAASKPAAKHGPVTLDGCVAASQTVRNTFTLDDDGRTYLLKGVNVRDFVGKHVEVIGALPKRLTIVGGLYPIGERRGAGRRDRSHEGGDRGAGRTDFAIGAAGHRIYRQERPGPIGHMRNREMMA